MKARPLRSGTESGERAPIFGLDERFLSVSQVGKLFGVADVTIKSWVDAGNLLAARTVGGHRRIAVSSVVSLLNTQGRAVPPELVSAKPTAVVLARDLSLAKTLRRELGDRIEVVTTDNVYSAMLSSQRLRPRVLVVDADVQRVDLPELVSALRDESVTRGMLVIVVGARFGRTQSIGRASRREGAGTVAFVAREDAAAMVDGVAAAIG